MNATNKGSEHRPVGWLGRFRDFRFLVVILGAWAALGLYEMKRTDLPKSSADVPPEWLLDDQVNLSKTLLELYPQRSLGHFLRGYQAGMCFDTGYRLPVCNSFKNKDPRDAQEAVEKAIELGGLRNQEELFHFYSVILVRNGEDPEKVNEAIEQWRRHHPYSNKRADPR